MADLTVHASIDDYLGPAPTRFFGNGYRRIGQRLSDLFWDPERGTLLATAGVVYPRDWSVKQTTTPIAPHLSTIDALVFAAQLAEAGLTARHGLLPLRRQTMWLRRVEIRAGSAPKEDGLAGFPVSADVKDAVDATGSLLGHHSVVVCRIAHMTVRCTVEHPALAAGGQLPAGPLPADLFGDAARRPYGTGYLTHRQSITNLVADRTEALPRASATVVTSAGEGDPPGEGLEGAYQPGMSLVDAFVIALQMGQVLLYELDGLTRADSSTLWMRRTVLEAASPVRPVGEPTLVETVLDDAQVVESRGATWRSADIVSDCGGIRLRCSVTHRLPAGRHLASRSLQSS